MSSDEAKYLLADFVKPSDSEHEKANAKLIEELLALHGLPGVEIERTTYAANGETRLDVTITTEAALGSRTLRCAISFVGRSHRVGRYSPDKRDTELTDVKTIALVYNRDTGTYESPLDDTFHTPIPGAVMRKRDASAELIAALLNSKTEASRS